MGIDSKKKKVLIMILMIIILQEADAALERMINEKVAEKREQAVSQDPKNVEQLYLIVNKHVHEKITKGHILPFHIYLIEDFSSIDLYFHSME